MEQAFIWLRWTFILLGLGWLVFPLAYRIFKNLPDRGLGLMRPLGLLLWGYLFWLLSSFGVLRNDLGGLWMAVVLVALLVIWAVRADYGQDAFAWLKENASTALRTEALFLIAMLMMSLFRSLYPALVATEKPMELAFINAVMRSPQMPPLDPWLSGYAISYYYMGYLLVGMLAQVAGTSAGIAFNLAISTVFALTAAGAYSIVGNMLRRWQPQIRAGLIALFGPLFVLIVSNMEGFLEMLHMRGVFWQRAADGSLVSSFWTWLDIKDLLDPPTLEATQLRFWWWWRASRVVRDYGFGGGEQEVIDEFPFFSYLLADLHPHVLAMPFALLAVALALNIFWEEDEGQMRIGRWMLPVSAQTFWLGAFVFGGLAFLNFWDFPVYVGLFAGALLIRRGARHGWNFTRLWEFLGLGIAFGVGGVLLYLPYHISFSSQAGGILPNLINPTRGAQLWVMFGTLFLPIFAFLASLWAGRGSWAGFGKALLRGFAVVLAFWLISLLLLMLVTTLLPALGFVLPSLAEIGSIILGLLGAPDLGSLLRESLSRRLAAAGGWITLAILIGLAFSWFWPGKGEEQEASSREHQFSVLLITLGALMVLIPEFVYLRDNFGTRMNTVFKFYFQAWMLWGLAAAYAAGVLLSDPDRPGRRLWFTPLLLVTLFIGLAYPTLGVYDKVREYQQANGVLNLDGTLHPYYLTEDDRSAVNWLLREPLGTLSEAIGGSYTGYARISAHSGQPTVLGWPGHEGQWRGGGEEMGSRYGDIERLYTTASWDEARAIIEQYHITYVYIGPLEFSTYAVNEGKFAQNLNVVFQQGGVTIYQVPDHLINDGSASPGG